MRRISFQILSKFSSVSSMAATTEILRVKKLSENAIIPTRGSEFAAGFDLSSAVDTVVPARGKAIVKTDLAIAIPEFTYARIAPRHAATLLRMLLTTVLI